MLSPTAKAELREFYDLAYDQAWRYLSRMSGGDHALTEDLVQEVMLSVARDLAVGRSPRREAAWIVTVAHNRFINHVRSVGRAESRLARATDRSSGYPTTGISERAAAAAEQARELLAQLPLEQRAAVALRHLDGYNVREIAEKLGKSVEATESLIARGVRTLRQLGPETN